MSAPWRRLADLSLQALNANQSDLELKYLAGIATEHAKKHASTTSGSKAINFTLEDGFGVDGADWLCRRPGDQTIERPLTRRFATTHLRPQQCLALLATCDVTFDEAVEAIKVARLNSVESDGDGQEQPTADRFHATTLDEAKAVCLAFRHIKPTLTAFRQSCSRAFWIIRLDDPKWLVANGGPRWPTKIAAMPAVPSIAQDRRTIDDVSGDGRKRVEARMRARYRDAAWLDKFVRPREMTYDRLETVSDALEKARTAHMEIKGQPVKWAIATAARVLAMPTRTLVSLSRNYPRIRALVPKAPTSYRTRKMAWCVEQCKERRIEITLGNIYQLVLKKRQPGNNRVNAEIFRRLTQA